MKVLKKIIAMVLLIVIVSSYGFGNMPVIDISNLFQSVEQLYAIYEQVMTSIEQVQNTYTQIEAAAKEVASINWEDYASIGDNFVGLNSNPFDFITAVNTTAQDIENAVNKKLNQVKDLKKTLTNKTISFGGMDVSVAELCGHGSNGTGTEEFVTNATDVISSTAEKAAKSYEKSLTPEQRRAIFEKWGMEPYEYAYNLIVNNNLSGLLSESNILGTIEAIDATMQENEGVRSVLNNVASNLPDGNMKSALEVGLKYDALISEGIEGVKEGLTGISSMISNIFSAKDSQEKMEKKQQAQKAEANQIRDNKKGVDIYD